MLAPSGENVGCASPLFAPVTARICFDATSITCTEDSVKSPECGETARTKVMDDPSGDQVTGDAGGPGGQLTGRLHVPDVSRCGSPPAEGMVQMWLGIAPAWIRKSSFWTSNA